MGLNCYIYASKNGSNLKCVKYFRKHYKLHNAIHKVKNVSELPDTTTLTYKELEEVCYHLIDDEHIIKELSDVLDKFYNHDLMYVWD